MNTQTATSATSATFTHDCESCRLLTTVVDGGQVFDLYSCPEEGSVVARFGDAGPDYSSSSITLAMMGMGGPLRIAAILATAG